MYELNGIVYGSDPSCDLKVAQITDMDDYILLVTFSTGETRLLDCTELFSQPAFQKLEDKEAFKTLEVEDGVLAWLDGKVGSAPEALYAHSHEYPTMI